MSRLLPSARYSWRMFQDLYLQQPANLPAFYYDHATAVEAPHFSVYARAVTPCQPTSAPARLDLVKVSLLTAGTGLVTHDGRSHPISSPTLAFLHPRSAWSWQATSEEQAGYFCLFNAAFLAPSVPAHYLQQYPHLLPGAPPVLYLSPTEAALAEGLFAKLLQEFATPGPLRPALLRLTLQMLLLEAQRFAPAAAEEPTAATAARLAYRFLALLEQQFPLQQPDEPLRLKAPHQYAAALAVQSNHLSSCVRAVTGQSVRAHLQGRLLSEARSLLRHSDWPVAQIAYVLGFEEPAAFTHFFRRHTRLSPLAYRAD